MAVVATGFKRCLAEAEELVERGVSGQPWRATAGGFAVGVLAIWLPEVAGNGYEPLNQILDHRLATTTLIDPNAPTSVTNIIGRTSAFKTSTGLELRFFMPVLNVPFRLIYSFNPQRGGVLDNNFRPVKETTFRFAVGTTF